MGNFEKKLDKANKYFKNKNYKEALKICDKILTKDYNNEKALELEGEILFKLDRIDEAILNWKINSEYNNNPTAKMRLADMDKETKEKALSYDNLNTISSIPEGEIEDVVNPNEASKEGSPSANEETPNAPDEICEESNKIKEEPTLSEDNIKKPTENLTEESTKENTEETVTNQNEKATEILAEEITEQSAKNIDEPSEDVNLNTSSINEEKNSFEEESSNENNDNNSPKTEENNNDTSNTEETSKNTKTSLSKGKKSAIIAVCAIIIVAASYAAVKHFNNTPSTNNTEQSQAVKEEKAEENLKANLDKAMKDKDMNAIYTLLTEVPKDKVPSDAKETYDQATDMMKKDGVEKFYNEGLDSYKDKKYDVALENLSKAYKFCDGSYLEPHILYFMGSTYNALDKKDDAVKYFEDYLKKYPHSDLYTAEVLYNLCLYYNDKGDKSQAKKYAQQLEDSYPSSPYYNDTSRKILYN
ncbi:tetratricopeptide repeat protein [Eubacterium multiforme]|uniref:Tetratricopeptide (TPR) repeat protein n=1 Tax=Eubacterium multiforme TaxID=83339 RepID=A0ABT9UX81_9FIRM|nr:tetratricopeptide repeat protein [Eubacterium multiforme]MDQ0150934.1 tetratricopeptide (TPR) repeat protein [Eubacterium multiforme]